MLKKKEITNIIVITIILAISISLIKNGEIAIKEMFLPTLLMVFIVIAINVFFKKITANSLGVKIDIKMWEIKQWGIQKFQRFRTPLNLGVILPIVLKIISLGHINFTAALVYDVEAKIYRAAKKHGLYAFTEISEAQIGAIAAAGIAANLLASIIAYLIGYPRFARISLGFVFWNLLPISNLDGNKIFFGGATSKKGPLLWYFLMLLTLVGLFLSIFMI